MSRTLKAGVIVLGAMAIGLAAGAVIALSGGIRIQQTGGGVIGSVFRNDIDTSETDDLVSLEINQQSQSIKLQSIDVPTGGKSWCPNRSTVPDPVFKMEIDVKAQKATEAHILVDCVDGKTYTLGGQSAASLVQTTDGNVILRIVDDDVAEKPWLEDWMLDQASSSKIITQFAIPKTSLTTKQYLDAHRDRYAANEENVKNGNYGTPDANPPDLSVVDSVALTTGSQPAPVKPEPVESAEPLPDLPGFMRNVQVTRIEPRTVTVIDPPSNVRSIPVAKYEEMDFDNIVAVHGANDRLRVIASAEVLGSTWFYVPSDRGWIHESQVR